METKSFSYSFSSWKESIFIFALLFLFFYGWHAWAESDADPASNLNFFQDTDHDGLSNEEEKTLGTDPNNADTDGDGYSDGVEVESGYNPLKPAPGDRTVVEETKSDTTTSADKTDVANVTEKTSAALAGLVQGVATGTTPEDGLKSEDISTALEDALDSASSEVVLPDIDIDSIKVKKVPKNLKGDDKKEREKEDVLKYLTLISYIMVNNSPITMEKNADFQKVVDALSTDSIGALSSGDFGYLDTFSVQGQKFLDQIKDVEVPESMLDTHVKAMQLAEYAVTLKDELKNSQTDPLGQVAAYGKVQGFLSASQSLMTDVEGKLTAYGIQDLPLGM